MYLDFINRERRGKIELKSLMRLPAMPCITTDAQPKILLSIVQCKLLQSLIRNCLKTSYDLSSEDESTYYDLNTKHMILRELRRRSMRASSKSNEHFYSLYQTSNYDNINQFHQKRSGRQLEKFRFNGSLIEPVRSSICNTDINTQKEKIEEDNNFDSETQSFFSAKSNFSSSSSQSTIIAHRSMFEQFKHLEGWPFGLLRRPIVLLPPLPPTPANSWLWLRRNSEHKAGSIVT